MIWTVGQTYNADDNDFYNRFDFVTTEVKGYYSWQTHTQKEISPMTVEVLYEKLKPCYKELYLKNGNLYRRECYYGS